MWYVEVFESFKIASTFLKTYFQSILQNLLICSIIEKVDWK